MFWPWRTATPGAMPLAKRALVAVGGLVAVGMAEERAVAVARAAAGLLDGAIAGGKDRRAAGAA